MTKLQQLMREVVKRGPISKKELQEYTDISWGMVSDLVNQLVEEKYIVPSIRETSGVGRKAEEFDVNHDEHFCIGIDLSSNGLLGVVTDLKGRVVKQAEASFVELNKDCVLDAVFQMTDCFFEEFSERKIYGIGFSLQGIVDIYDGVSALISAIQGWENVSLKEIMEERYHVPTFTEHDPNCIMLAERAVGCLKDRDIREAVLMNFDPRVGAGMSTMTRGQLIHGVRGRAGEIGCNPVDITPDGKWHHMEDRLIYEGLLKEYQEQTGVAITQTMFVALLEMEDPVCINIYQKLGRNIGFALAIANNYMNPEVIVLYLAESGQKVLFDTISKLVKKVSFDPDVELILSKSGPEMKAVGGALILSEKALLAL